MPSEGADRLRCFGSHYEAVEDTDTSSRDTVEMTPTGISPVYRSERIFAGAEKQLDCEIVEISFPYSMSICR